MKKFWTAWNSRVESRAVARAGRLGRSLVVPDDYHAAYLGELLDTGYDLVGRWRLLGRPRRIPENWRKTQGVCRYCLRGSDRTSFKYKSHAIPEFFGNTSLISSDECDRCNRTFSQSFEGHLDKFTLPIRAYFGVKGKSRYPKYKPDARNESLWLQRSGDVINTMGTAADRVIEETGPNSAVFSLRCQPLVLCEVYRGFVKMALAVMTAKELSSFDLARRWVVSESVKSNLIDLSWAWCYLGMVPGRDPEPIYCLWRRRFSPFPVPYYIAAVSLRCFVWLYAVPGGAMDRPLQGRRMVLPRFDFADCDGLEAGFWQAFSLHSRDIDENVVYKLDCTTDGFEDVSD